MKRRIYSFEELDSTGEIVDAMNQIQLDVANEVEALQAEIERINDKISKKNGKKKGFVMSKVLVVLAAVCLFAGVIQAQYKQSDINYEIASNPQMLADYLRDTIGTVEVFRLTPTSEPTTQLLEGQIYYDSTAGALFVYDSTTDWVELADASGVSLDGAYNAGNGITVDGTAVTLTVPDAAGIAGLIITYSDATTNAMDAVQITNAGDDGAAVSIQIDSTAGYDIQGTGDVWNVTYAGVATLVGLVTSTGDVTFTGANYDIIHDASADQLEFQDNAEISFGTDQDVEIAYDNTSLNITCDDKDIRFGADGAGGDVTFFSETASTWLKWSEANDQLEFELSDLHLSSDTQIEIENDAGTVDWTIDNATDETLLFYPTQTTDDQSINLGTANNTTDLRIFGASASTVVFDASADIVITTDYNVNLTDADELRFGTGASGGAGDFKISGSTTPLLLIDAVVDGTGEITIGNDADDLPLKWYTDTTGDWVYFNDDEVEFEDCVLIMMDATQLQFGDSADFYIHATNTACTLGTLTTDETSSWNFGADTAGADLQLFGTTSGDKLLWDASDDYLHMIGDKVLFTLAEASAANVFKVDCTGASGDTNVIVLETSDGGIQLLADGDTEGDIDIDCEDDMTLTAAGDLTVTVTGTTTIANMATFTVGYQSTVFDAVAAAADGAGNSIPAGTSVVNISAITNDADDWVALPVGVLGEKVTIIATVACELRTLATTDDQINEVDSDGTQEYQLTAGDIVECICVEAGVRWTANSHTILGAAKTIIPD